MGSVVREVPGEAEISGSEASGGGVVREPVVIAAATAAASALKPGFSGGEVLEGSAEKPARSAKGPVAEEVSGDEASGAEVSDGEASEGEPPGSKASGGEDPGSEVVREPVVIAAATAAASALKPSFSRREVAEDWRRRKK